MKLRNKWIVPLLAGIFLLAGCGNPDTAKPVQAAVTSIPERIPVTTQAVTKGSISAYLETTANIEAAIDITIYPKLSGQIEAIFVEEGDRVKKGQILARLDDDELRLGVQKTLVNKQQLQQKFQRIEELYKANMISEESYLDAKYNLENAEVSFQLASLDLSHSEVTSPIDGIVTRREISIGDRVQNSTPLFRIYDPKSLNINIFLPEIDVHRLSVEMPATVIPESFPDHEIQAKISRINPAVDPTTGTIKVTLDVRDTMNRLKPGMFTRVKIRTENKNDALLVPKKAILRSNGTVSVFVISEEMETIKKKLSVGIEDSEYYEVIDGLAESDRVIVVGQHGLESGMTVSEFSAEDSSSSADTIPLETPLSKDPQV
ncbi:efflux RND transporter periplasmic adaptor subunit [bacterium]|nr:efflux RND transporter periplasmic adaptor subunit [candidate division CSSED10-310 bacterium]